MSNPLHFYYPSFVRFFCLALGFSLLTTVATQAQNNCDCTNCPQFMPDGFTGTFTINVQNASNPTLGQNGQGVCGVVLNFDHEYLGDLSITLTSPSGQTVTLVGPIGFFGPTDGTTWNVTFLPCGDSPNPDPGFTANWNNNQAWGLFGNYSGSYYPNNGCLENFTGPVNGTWSLTVTDGQAVDVGNFYDYEIIFCDPSGIDCFSCAANAGNLLQPDVIACEGSNNLNLDLPPSYPAGVDPPPSPEYSYTYVIAGTGGIIQAYEPVPDLTAYPPGQYTICGMSYLTAQEGDIPTPNGSLTIQQLTTQLNSSAPPFCGKITTNCVNVTINPAPQDLEEFVEVCAPQCYVFYNQTYCQSGTFVRNLTTPQGCPYTATLYLTVYQPSFKTVNEFVCEDACSQTPGFSYACSPGTYQEVFTNAAGCDSTVTLNLSNVFVQALIAQPVPTVGCTGNVTLSGFGSTSGAGTTYLWTASNGGNIVGPTTNINASINAPGDYQLRVCRTTAGITCCDSIEVGVQGNQNPPATPGAITGNNAVCSGQSYTFSVAAVAGASSYTWTVPAGVTITAGQNTSSITVQWNSTSGGDVCVTATNACGTSQPSCLTVSASQIPVATTPQGNTTVCGNATQNYSIPAIANATTYNWTVTAPAVISSGQGTNQITVNWNGAPASSTVCVSAGNNCGNSAPVCLPVTVGSTPASPTVSGSNSACAGGVATYTVANVPGATSYNWTVTNGTITSGQGTSSIQVSWNVNAASGTVCANASNACGASTDNCFNLTLSPAPAQPDITGDATLCAGSSGDYTIAPVGGATGYVWTVPAGASISSGQNTTAISVAWPNGNPGGNVCVSAAGGCGTGPQDCFPVVIDVVPVANAGPDAAICGTQISLTAVPSVAGSNGQWVLASGPGTATFDNASQPATNVTVSQIGLYIFQWTETNVICVDQDSVSINFNAAPAAGLITHDCDNTNQNFTVSFPVSGGAAPYTIPGGTISGGIFTSDLIPNSQTYSFLITDANGCVSAAISGAYNCNCATNAGAMDLTTIDVCEDQNATATPVSNPQFDGNDIGAYVLHTNSGPSLGVIIAQNATGVFGFQAGMNYGQTYYISHIAGNNLGGSPDPTDPCFSIAQGQPVIFHQNPVALAGADVDTCSLELVLAANSGIGTGVWSVVSAPPGGNITLTNAGSPGSTAAADLAGTYTLAWTLDNAGCTASDQVNLLLQPNNAGQMASQTLSACEGATISAQYLGGQAYGAGDTSAFILHTGNGTTLGTVLDQNHTGIFGFVNGMTYGQTYYVSHVVGLNSNGLPDLSDPCLAVSPGQPVVFNLNPIPNAGPDDDNCGNTLTLNASNALPGTWSIVSTPAGGNLTFNDAQDPATSVNASEFGQYTLQWSATQNGCPGSDLVTISFFETPGLADLTRDCDNANENYTVTLTLSGGTQPYAVNGNPVTGNTFTSPAFANNQSYNFVVTDANGCIMPDINGSFSCDCATSAGTMNLQTLQACEDGTVSAQANADASLDGNDVLAFVLHTGSGPALGTILASNTTGEFGFLPGMSYGTEYYISRVAGTALAGVPDPSDPCFSVAPGQPVIFLQNPIPNAGVDNAVCAQMINLQAVNNNFSGLWTQVSGPGTATFSSASQAGSGVTVSAPGLYTFRWTETNSICSGSDVVEITFNDLPVVGVIDENCNGTNTAYTIVFTVTGGSPAYTLNGVGGSFSGSVFTSQPLPNGAPYTFTVTDQNGCTSLQVSDAHNCDCATDAGTMQLAPLAFCADQPAVASWNNDAQTDADDLVRFILHDQPDNSLGTVFATSSQPSFNFQAGLQFGVTYYISAIAGSTMIGGNINLNDPCLSIAFGTPVQWKPIPTATLSGDATICAGSSTNLTFSGTGQFPLTLTYSDSQSGQNSITLNNSQPFVLPVQPTASTTYTLVSVSDGTQPTCAATLNIPVQVIVNQPIEAGSAASPFEICAGQSNIVQLASLLVGADPGGSWTETSAIPSQGGSFNAVSGAFQTQNQAPGTYSFRYLIDAPAPCADDETIVSVIIHPQTIADAGPDITLDCIETSTVLGGPATSTGSGVNYLWQLNGTTVGNATGPNLSVEAGGNYTLVVNNSAGCSDTDNVVVVVDNEAPQAGLITVKDVRCFGETNGAILIDSVAGGQPPVLFSLNNSPFTANNLFAGLPEGGYVVTLQGANGCSWTSDSLFIEEPPLLEALLGNDIRAKLGDSVFLELTTLPINTPLSDIVWSPLLDSAHAGTNEQRFFPLRSWQISVMVTDSNGCTATDRINVLLDKRRNVFIPNILAPASSENGFITIYGGQDVVEIESFRIFDRWGEAIFEAYDFQPEEVEWAGKQRGEEVLPGVYVYYAVIRFIDGESEVFTGDITVYR
ncbi:MAG: proprotein convertase P-domain-containing protein [Saprospiraceae bacterium]|nr:proprotein convertase P-domain-containing protein [Saprospiraceae bacterium]